MQKIEDLSEIYSAAFAERCAGKLVGVVPTMGALHDGHLSLVREAKAKCDVVVTTIFVNPTQFAPGEDLEKYPRTLERDTELLESCGNDIVFCPQNSDIYPTGFSTYVQPPQVSQKLEGTKRPSHFRGVATIVLKLFQLVPSDFAFFGQKDYQQTCVIRRMVADLNVPVKIEVCPIVREADGLAMSSRNAYLSPTDRKRAVALFQAIKEVEAKYKGPGSEDSICESVTNDLAKSVDEVEYLQIVDSSNLEPAGDSTKEVVVLVAARVGETRLIDNLLIPIT